jgi:hypothetical protein
LAETQELQKKLSHSVAREKDQKRSGNTQTIVLQGNERAYLQPPAVVVVACVKTSDSSESRSKNVGGLFGNAKTVERKSRKEEDVADEIPDGAERTSGSAAAATTSVTPFDDGARHAFRRMAAHLLESAA